MELNTHFLEFNRNMGEQVLEYLATNSFILTALVTPAFKLQGSLRDLGALKTPAGRIGINKFQRGYL